MALQRRSGRRPINRVISKWPQAMSGLGRCCEKGLWGGLLATLIQDQEQMRNHDSRNHLPGFVRFNF